jgi:3-oxoacyl-[acyl-carrier-protein] synthase II
MKTEKREVWVTGIGLVSSLGEGLETHWRQMAPGSQPKPNIDSDNQAPYTVHPIVDFDITQQIPKRSDQRQMGQWQHLGVHAAGLALDDAGISGNPDLLAATNMIVAAGGGERDIEVDSAIMEAISEDDNPGARLNAMLSTELRPTLFLAQLSNLMAGNISIVHGVTDSSRTFMGEESAGVSAIQTAAAQIAHGQGDIFLVGGAYIAERADMTMLMEFGHTLWREAYCPVWSRKDTSGGMIMGSAGVFLILESRQHAESRGVRPYARIKQVVSDRSQRQEGAARAIAEQLFDRVSPQLPPGPLPVLTSCCGLQPQLNEELEFLQSLSSHGHTPCIRGVTSLFGNTLEAQFPLGIALASLAVSKQAFFDPFSSSDEEQAWTGPAERVLVNTWGHKRGEAMGLIDTPDSPLRGGEQA